MFGVLNRINRQEGFSMAEVVMATLLFTASVLGISGMLVSGGANITRGATESAASNLASRRIEEVRSLPYYKKWDSDVGDQDVDDFYYNEGQTNANQLENPSVIEDYGTIPGFTKYRRTTAVQYQYVSGGQLAPAVMCTQSPFRFVPKEPSTGETDVPMGGATGAAQDDLHALIVEVCVYYKAEGDVQSYDKVHKERTLISDITTAGATNAKFLLIRSIDPVQGDYLDTHMNMTVYVDASPQFGIGSQVDVRLWRPGEYDIVANNPVPSAGGSYITCWFDLSDPDVKLGIPYNLSVYWKDGGWTDVFRDCFIVVEEPPTITGVADFDWACSTQTARRVTITGTKLWNTSNVTLQHPDYPDSPYQNSQAIGSIVDKSGTQVIVNFNMAAAETRPDERWNVVLTTGGGTDVSENDSERVRVNPPPSITRVTPTSSPDYYDWAYRAQNTRNVRIEGEYLYGLTLAEGGSAKLAYGEYATTPAYLVAGQPAVNDWETTTPAVIEFSPSSAGAPVGTNDTRWKVRIDNAGTLDDAYVQSDDVNDEKVWMNPPPVITNITGFPSPARTGSAGGNIISGLGVTGTYLQDNPEGVWLVRTAGQPPATNDTYLKLNNGSQTTNAAGTAVTGLTMRVYVNPLNDSFKLWPASTGAGNSVTGGTYYLYFKNADGQAAPMTGHTVTVDHAQYTVGVARSIPDGLGYDPAWYGTVSQSGSGTYWQDESVTLTATPQSGHMLFKWTDGTSNWTTNPLTLEVTASKTYTGWFWRKLYWAPDTGGPNAENFVTGYNSGSGTSFNPLDWGDGLNMWVNAWDTSATNREIAGVTNSALDFSGVTRACIEWKQQRSGAYADFIIDNDKNGDKNNYTRRIERTDQFGTQVQSLDATGLGSNYVRVHARSAGSGLWPLFYTSRPSEVRVYRVWLE
jgi:hypothetical protein